MPPKKEKVEKATQDEAVDMIMEYLKKQNRPYSAIDISANLHNKVTKTTAAKILKDLHERKEIEGRTSGKQTVYHPIQPTENLLTPEQHAELDAEIIALAAETEALKAEEKALKPELAALLATPTTEQLREQVSKLEAERDELLACLKPLREGDVEPMDIEEIETLEAELKKWRRIAGRRRKIVGDMWGTIEDALPEDMDLKELREKLGLDD